MTVSLPELSIRDILWKWSENVDFPMTILIFQDFQEFQCLREP